MAYIDAHSHWSDSRFSDENIQAMVAEAKEKRITKVILGGVDPADWQKQVKLKKIDPHFFELCFGLHPYFIGLNSKDDCDAALNELAVVIGQARFVGETGLDFRSKYAPTDQVRAQQIDFFEQQIEMATACNKPLVLHLVQAHFEAQRILNVWDLPDKRGFIHAFNSEFVHAKVYLDLGFKISVGGALTHPRNRALRDAVAQIPIADILLESDAPDQAPLNWEGLNQSWSIRQVAECLSNIKGDVTAEEVLRQTTDNFKKLFL